MPAQQQRFVGQEVLVSTNVIDETFLLQNIVVKTARLLGNQVALVLAIPLIWAAFVDVDDSFLLLPDDLKNRVHQECQEIGLILETNPVDKIAIEPIVLGADLSFVELSGQQDDGPQPTGASQALSIRANAVIISQETVMIKRLKEMNNNLINKIARLQNNFNQKLDNMNRSM